MNSALKMVRRTVSVTAIPTALAMFLTVVPFASDAARAQTLREAGKAAAQSKICEAKALEAKLECEAEEKEDDDGVPDRTGLGWTGIGLASAGGALVLAGITADRWRSCGPSYRARCERIERVYRISGGTLVATGLAFLFTDEIRRQRKKRIAVAVGPRAIEVRMDF